jgi:hypothetical protein
MKTLRNRILFAACLLGVFFAPGLSAEPPSPPADGHGGENNKPPAEAPIDGGAGILLALGIAFAGRKFYKNRPDCKKSR